MLTELNAPPSFAPSMCELHVRYKHESVRHYTHSSLPGPYFGTRQSGEAYP